jgi:flagellar basal body-associated protein FliL
MKKENEKGAAVHGAAEHSGNNPAHGHKPAAGDTGKKKKAAKPIPKWMVWIPVGLVVILLEVGVSYTLVNRFTAPKTGGEDAASEAPSKKDEGAVEKEAPKTEKKEERKENKQDREEPPSGTLKSSVAGEQEIKIESFYTLEDLVVNPAFSNGKHYFILSVALTFDNSSKGEMVREFEPILRDRLLSHLSAKTFYWLSTHTNREVLRREVGEVVGEVLKSPSGVSIYFTKYVLQ